MDDYGSILEGKFHRSPSVFVGFIFDADDEVIFHTKGKLAIPYTGIVEQNGSQTRTIWTGRLIMSIPFI